LSETNATLTNTIIEASFKYSVPAICEFPLSSSFAQKELTDNICWAFGIHKICAYTF